MNLLTRMLRIWLVLASATFSVLVPGIMLYGIFSSSTEAERAIEASVPGQKALLVGINHGQRSYLLFPDLLRDWSIVTAIEQENAWTVERGRYSFFLWLAIIGPLVWYGVRRAWPSIFRGTLNLNLWKRLKTSR